MGEMKEKHISKIKGGKGGKRFKFLLCCRSYWLPEHRYSSLLSHGALELQQQEEDGQLQDPPTLISSQSTADVGDQMALVKVDGTDNNSILCGEVAIKVEEVEEEHPNCEKNEGTQSDGQCTLIPEDNATVKDEKCRKRCPSKIHIQQNSYLYTCHLCSTSFKRKYYLCHHLKRVHSIDKPFDCDVCELSFSEQSELKLHQITHAESKPYTCCFCEKKFSFLRHLKKHSKIHDANRPLKRTKRCKVCRKMFPTLVGLKRHTLLKHKDAKENTCLKLKQVNRKELQKQIDKEAKLDTFKVKDVKGNMFKRKDMNENTMKRKDTNGKKHSCKSCGETFTRYTRLKNHSCTSTDEKPVLMAVHDENRKFACHLCDKRFLRKLDLRVHQVTHTGKKEHICVVCNKGFTQSSSLKTHQLIHKRNKTFSCDGCNQKFLRKVDLQSHRIIHIDKQHFACGVCGKHFTQRSSLKTHQLIHTEEKKFRCDVCSKTFLRKAGLDVHRVVHSGFKPFQCQKCDRCFTQRSSLNTHMYSRHKK